MADHNLLANLDCLLARRLRGATDEIKFVLSSEADFLWARELVLRHDLERNATVLFSPVRPLLDPARLAELLLAHRLNVRLQLQLHTLLWPGCARGV